MKRTRNVASDKRRRKMFTILWTALLAIITILLLYWEMTAVLYILAIGSVRGFALFLGISTILDLFVAYFFMHPIVSLMARRPHLVTMKGVGIAAGLAFVALAVLAFAYSVGRRIRVLLAGSPENRFDRIGLRIRRTLERAGYDVMEAGNVLEEAGIEATVQNPPRGFHFQCAELCQRRQGRRKPIPLCHQHT